MAFFSVKTDASTNLESQKLWDKLRADTSLAQATFAGGCFWCLEAPFEHTEGVAAVVAGYAADHESPVKDIRNAQTSGDHRESVQVFYHPDQISYQALVDLFWLQIDATDAGGQFYDRGYGYTTAIYYHNEEQQKIAEASKEALDKSGTLDKPVATKVVPIVDFIPAEDYHQSFYTKQPEYYQRYEVGSGRKAQKEKNKTLLTKK